jgi:uncharacterized membrane protein YiaA
MNKEYQIVAKIYSFLQFFFFLFVIVFTAGMNPNRPNVLPIHFWIFVFVVSNIFLLFYFPHTFKANHLKLKYFIAILCILLLVITLGIVFYLLWKIIIEGMDGGIFSIIFLTCLSLTDLYLTRQIMNRILNR